jgi:hypothetical protein
MMFMVALYDGATFSPPHNGNNMISTMTLRSGLPVAHTLHPDRPLHLWQLADNQIIRTIHNKAKVGLGIPAGQLTPYDEFGATWRAAMLRARQMTFVLLEDYIDAAYFCTAFCKRQDTASVNHHARKAHAVAMQEPGEEGDRYRRTFVELSMLIARELAG